MKNHNKKLWSGRFKNNTDPLMERFNASIDFDRRLFPEDIEGSSVHAAMLKKIGILSHREEKALQRALAVVKKEIQSGKFLFTRCHEDIHMAIETRLTELIGETGKKLHTARSRNDQVNQDVRLYLSSAIRNICCLLHKLVKTLADKSEKHIDFIMPGLTHLQPAQPVSAAFHLCAHAFALLRDAERFSGSYQRTARLSLGSGALAGVNYPTDREFLARNLKMNGIIENAMDAVSDRDFILEFLSAGAVCGMHLSRMAEEIIIWSNPQFGFIKLDDRYSTGSSMMPNKKNPDAAELIRGKTGRLYGNLFKLFTVMKALPLAYNKDLQEDKEPLFDTIDTLEGCIGIMTRLTATLQFNKNAMLAACSRGFVQATDLADYLVKKNIPFRSAHEITGRLVLYCEKKEKTIPDLTMEEYRLFSTKFDKDVMEYIAFEKCLERKQSYGSTSKISVKKQLSLLRKYLEKMQKNEYI